MSGNDMNLKMNLNVFMEKLSNELTEAIKYKNNFIPNSLYKYIPLLDDRYINYKEENKKKTDSLKANKLWISHYTQFNDPFEFKMMTIDVERLKDTKWEVNYIEEVLDLFKNNTLISCFSSEVDNNMPMWAHYANNHRGFCIKYTVLNPQKIFPVLYVPTRTKSAVIVTNLINEMYQMYKQNLKKPTEKFYEYLSYFYLSFCCKHDFWKYENEYRLLYPSINFDIITGKLIDLPEVGLRIDSIYIGYKCEEEYISELANIGKSIGCNVYKMNFDENSENFSLTPERLC